LVHCRKKTRRNRGRENGLLCAAHTQRGEKKSEKGKEKPVLAGGEGESRRLSSEVSTSYGHDHGPPMGQEGWTKSVAQDCFL